MRLEMNLTETQKISTPLRHFSSTVTLGLMVFVMVSPVALVKAPTSGTFAFAISGLAGTAGITCPDSSGNCYNNAAEPTIRADAAGNFYGSWENGLTGRTAAWRSAAAGLHYLSLVSAKLAPATSNRFSPAGGDPA